jgi:hypothetical protein
VAADSDNPDPPTIEATVKHLPSGDWQVTCLVLDERLAPNPERPRLLLEENYETREAAVAAATRLAAGMKGILVWAKI